MGDPGLAVPRDEEVDRNLHTAGAGLSTAIGSRPTAMMSSWATIDRLPTWSVELLIVFIGSFVVPAAIG